MLPQQPEESGHIDAVDVETLQGLEPISSLSAERLIDLAAKTFVETAKAGDILFKEGESDRKLVYLLNGEIELQSNSGQTIKAITAGMPETWHPIANKQPRQLSGVATTDVELLRIDSDQFDQMLTWDQMASAEVSDDREPNKNEVIGGENDWRMKLRATLALKQLPPANIETLFERMEPMDVKVGEVIIHQGEAGDYFYLIDRGSAKVTLESTNNGPAVQLAELGEGTSFGEEALLSDSPRNANVTMLTDGHLMRLSKSDFEELLKEPLLDQIELEDALNELVTGSAMFLDVRVASEFNQGHLPNAINIPLNELRQRINELDNEMVYVCYCNSGSRSSAATFLLSQQGFKSGVLKNGIQSVPNAYLIQ